MDSVMVRPEETDAAEFGKDQGLIHEVIVTGRKVGAGTAFYSALAHSEELFARTVAFVARGGEEVVREVGAYIPLTEAERMAIDILGQSKVLTRAQARGGAEFSLRYSKTVLHACAEENAKEADWRLVYLRGNSLRAERVRVGTNRKQQPCFDPDYVWMMSLAEDGWATQGFEPGYYLLDMNGRFGAAAWTKQGKKIAELGPEFVRAHEAMVTEAALRIFQATGERLLANWWHWGRSLASGRRRVSVGSLAGRGWRVYDYDCRPPWAGDAGLRVCLHWKFDIAA